MNDIMTLFGIGDIAVEMCNDLTNKYQGKSAIVLGRDGNEHIREIVGFMFMQTYPEKGAIRCKMKEPNKDNVSIYVDLLSIRKIL